ncbi:MAG: hypothetical protein ACI8WM_000682 [Burkholderiaceae bacterium]|jgi:hypothetical protein
MKTPTSPSTKQNNRPTLWRERLMRYAANSQTVAAFCRSESMSIASFYLWRKRSLASPDGAGAGAGDAQSVSAVSPRFIDLGPVTKLNRVSGPEQEVVLPLPATLTIELELGHGVVLRLLRS